ncbi:MAG: GspH/FimT family pseudopilin [Rhizobacter sp.]|nr:GspH/FimT family pseudopilin [Rhizobacter sp.]
MTREPQRRARGFTLIELLTTVAIIVIILTLAAPSFTAFQRNSELTGVANTMLSSLTAARSEAMKRGRNTLVVPSADCATWGDDWTKGWLVFVDNDGSQTIDSGDDVLSCEPKVPEAVTAVTGSAPEGFQDSGGKLYLMFNGSGYPRLLSGAFQSSSLDFTNGDSTRRIISNPAGRLRVCKPADAGCTAAAL